MSSLENKSLKGLTEKFCEGKVSQVAIRHWRKDFWMWGDILGFPSGWIDATDYGVGEDHLARLGKERKELLDKRGGKILWDRGGHF